MQAGGHGALGSTGAPAHTLNPVLKTFTAARCLALTTKPLRPILSVSLLETQGAQGLRLSVITWQVPLALYIIYSPGILANKLYSRTAASVTFLAISAGCA